MRLREVIGGESFDTAFNFGNIPQNFEGLRYHHAIIKKTALNDRYPFVHPDKIHEKREALKRRASSDEEVVDLHEDHRKGYTNVFEDQRHSHGRREKEEPNFDKYGKHTHNK
ncbi:hypothetical protein HY029_00105 [Candidatus Gottesmanbacteria bacterium]|nr:hypothetical protein [Candidatus Gottesmanbacteria bacterium]